MAEAEAHAHFISRGHAQWPEVALAEADALAFAAAHGVDLASVKHPEDLYLAYACAVQNPAALRIFDRELLAPLPAKLRSILPDADIIADLLQNLRQTLLWGTRGPGKLSEYRGAGPLRGWLTVVARRAALRISKGQERFVRPDEASPSAWDSVSTNPELQLLKSQHRAAFQSAFDRALRSLGADEAALLRAYFIDGRTLRDLAREQECEASTVWRRLEAIKLRLAREVEDHLRSELKIGASEFASLLGAVRSQLDLRVSESLPRSV